MKFLYPLLVSLLTASVSASKWRLCCCAGWNDCNQFVCDSDSAQNIVDLLSGTYVRSKKLWDRYTGSPIGGLDGWIYAKDDGFIGGNEMSDKCSRDYGLSSRCFDPKLKTGEYSDYSNDGKKIGSRQTLDGGLGGVGAQLKPKKPKSKGGGGGDDPPPARTDGKVGKKRKKPKKGKEKDKDKNHWPVCE